MTHKECHQSSGSSYPVPPADDNELITLEIIHHFVEVLDKYFGNVCELDLIFNFHKAYFMLDELLMAGELQEPSKRVSQKDRLKMLPVVGVSAGPFGLLCLMTSVIPCRW